MGVRRIELQTGVYLNTDARKIVTLSEEALTSGSIPVVTTNGRLKSSAMTYDVGNGILTVTSSYASNATSASWAPQPVVPESVASASWASASLSASYATTAVTASYAITASYFSGSILFYGNIDRTTHCL
jgi:hypothetical protein